MANQFESLFPKHEVRFLFIVLESEHSDTALLDQTKPPGCGRIAVAGWRVTSPSLSHCSVLLEAFLRVLVYRQDSLEHDLRCGTSM